ncbi:hypothetical protein [Leptolyngbya sp. NIES-2104]|nr:hypothetical protein [Leptolyngbya sp. NIES-2104]GAP98384.1 heat shock protein 60 family chaperone GroEL [Leptolyngbya sp. NIES-2104]
MIFERSNAANDRMYCFVDKPEPKDGAAAGAGAGGGMGDFDY